MAERPNHLPSRRRRRRAPPFPLFAALGLLLFCGGFLLAVKLVSSPSGQPPQKAGDAAGSNQLSGLFLPQVGGDAAQTPDASGGSSGDSGADRSPDASSGASGDGVPEESEWNLLLVNQDHPLPEDFQVPALTQLRNGQAIDSRAYPALQSMMDAARAEGLEPLVCSSFRTWDRQEELFLNKVQSYLDQGCSREEAEEKAAFWVARPGTSEHQAGLAVDIVDLNYQLLDEQQESTPVQRWLMEHCAEYGFILRYPTEKSGLTGVGYEPWHYRYVGVEAAREIMERGICLEEYLQAG